MKPQKEERFFADDLICQYRDEQEYPLYWHYHDAWELTKIYKGMGIRMIGSDTAPYSPGELILLPPGLPHSWNSETRTNKALYFQFKEETFSSLLGLPDMSPVRSLFSHAAGGLIFDSTVSQQAGVSLDRLSRTQGIDRILIIIDIFKILSLNRNYRRISSTVPSDYSNREPERINRILQFVDARYKDPITLDEIAAEVSMNKNSFCRYFKSVTFMTFMDYVQRKRISAACRLLLESEKPVIEVAYDSGFENIANFNRQFKKIMGRTPSSFRKANA